MHPKTLLSLQCRQKCLKEIKRKFPHVLLKKEDKICTFHCVKCDLDYRLEPRRLLLRRKYGCPSCGVRESAKLTVATKKQSQKDKNRERLKRVKTKLLEHPTLKLVELVQPEKGKPFFVIKCKRCGDVTKRPEQTILQLPSHTSGCHDCSAGDRSIRNLQKDLSHYKKRLKKFKSLILLSDPISRSSTVDFECSKCEHTFSHSFDVILNSPRSCPKCFPKSWRTDSLKRPHSSTVGHVLNGKLFYLQGTELSALNFIVQRGVEVSDIEANTRPNKDAPSFEYNFLGKKRTHTPDFYIRSKELFVESKSLETLGLHKSGENWSTHKSVLLQNKAKTKGAVKLGLNYRMLVKHRQSMIVLPKDWHTLSKKELVALFQ